MGYPMLDAAHHKLVVVPWARDEVWSNVGTGGTLDHHGELGRGNRDHRRFPTIKIGGMSLIVAVLSVEGAE